MEDFLLLNADAMFNTDFNWFAFFYKMHGWLVMENDIIAGKTTGFKTAFIGNENFGQDVSSNTLSEFVKIL